eukprot:TRINITY_DN5659_c0_g1_i1.p1 TRINITY_DN5659_c0_g1~~TRINITY_DN5659_c0_g1_i1.p1  ORF type:complete len:394 (+),score=95.75 TRINITY_DN5659_c0_g1_i1:51-1184(+)
MASNKRSFYEVLEVSSDASADDIKRTYKKLALVWHPDRCSDPEATQRFQEISEAYTVLSDPVKRQNYDRTGEAEPEEHVDFNDILSHLFGAQVFGGMFGARGGMPGMGSFMFTNSDDFFGELDDETEYNPSDDEEAEAPMQHVLFNMMMQSMFADEGEPERRATSKGKSKRKHKKKSKNKTKSPGQSARTATVVDDDTASPKAAPETSSTAPATTTTTATTATSDTASDTAPGAKAESAPTKPTTTDEDDESGWVELPEGLLEEFMEDSVELLRSGKLKCLLCDKTLTTERLMKVHFEKSHQDDAEEWAMQMMADADDDDAFLDEDLSGPGGGLGMGMGDALAFMMAMSGMTGGHPGGGGGGHMHAKKPKKPKSRKR